MQEGKMAKKILVIEDDIDIRESLQDFLESEGHHIETAENGERGLELLAKPNANFDLILLDLMMPVMNGVEFRKRQATHPEYSRIPVVVISADNRTREIADTLGLPTCVQKPMNLEDLLGAIERATSPEAVAGLRTEHEPKSPASPESSAW
jgi:CheY-like chemotaxis protein